MTHTRSGHEWLKRGPQVADRLDNPEDTRKRAGADAAATVTRWEKMVGILGIAVVVWVGTNLFDVVTSRQSGPGAGHGARGRTAPGHVTDDQGPPPPSGGNPHDPSRFRH